jgi:SAM-dependent methyltransferase
VNGVRREDLENLSFEDESFDLHVTQDVFEHLFNPAAAFREIARTLRPGGAHIFTTPIVRKNEPTRFCAQSSPEGAVIHLLEPEYHGNPISPEGSLVTVHWGYDITKFIFETSGLFTEIVSLDIIDYGIRAEYIEVLITRKFRREN